MAMIDADVQKEGKELGKITIGDVADALGISKTTVSRAISGKGRIGEDTRKRVMDYIEKCNYRPSPIAKGLAKSMTYNIGWVMPGDSSIEDLPFFQRCMIGVSEIASAEDYDVLVSMVYESDNGQLRRIVENKKVDGLIIGRTLVEDRCLNYLKEQDIPFVVVGSSTLSQIVQIDNDHIRACSELISILIMKGIKRPALIGGEVNHVVNQTRLKGYLSGLKSQSVEPDQDMIFMDIKTTRDVERVADEAMKQGADCIICMDDRLCYSLLSKLRKDGIKVPEQIKVASFYNSTLLENNQPPITALSYDPKELGKMACKSLFDLMKGENVPEKVLLGYEVVLKGSTQ